MNGINGKTGLDTKVAKWNKTINDTDMKPDSKNFSIKREH